MSGAEDDNNPAVDLSVDGFQFFDEQISETESWFKSLFKDDESLYNQMNIFEKPCNDGGFGISMPISSEAFSFASEAPSQFSALGVDQGIILPSKPQASDCSRLRISVPGNECVDSSNKHLSTTDGPNSFVSENDEADVMPSDSGRDGVQSESTINLKDGTHEINIQVPELGMVFSSEDEAYNFYTSYAKQTGFIVRKGKIRKLADGTIRSRYFFCSKEGYRPKKQSEGTKMSKRKETRTGCGAFVRFTIDNGKWEIADVVLHHNHVIKGSSPMDVTSPPTNISNKDISVHSRKIDEMEKEGGDANSSRFHLVDRSKYSSIEKTNFLPPEDIQSLINFLKRLQLEDPLFFYTVQVDAKSCLKSLFWRDGRSKIDYEYFGDVMILDTTFRVGGYDIICAPFWGLNHHQQYVLFGCAFLFDASVDSFVWLIGTFVEAMGLHLPRTIFTGECQLISDAIERALPETQHRIGKWFILQNARKYLSELYGQQGFEDLFNKCIYCNSKEEFQSMWEEFLVKYNLHENEWLKNLHMMQKKWSNVFSETTFSAGKESLLRFKNMHSVFHPLETGDFTLSTVAQQYLSTAKKWRKEEVDEDFLCRKSEPSVKLRGNQMEKQAADVYTHTIFKLFQDELLGCLSVALKKISRDEGCFKFKVTEEGDKESIVEYSRLESNVTCSCKKYESVGILCVHSLKVLNAENIFDIPSQYILKRWKKSVKDEMLLDDCIQETNHESQGPFYTSRLMLKALHIVSKSLGVKRNLKIVDNHLDLALREIEDVLRTEKTGSLLGAESMELQTTASSPLSYSQKELSGNRIKIPLKRNQEPEVRGTKRNSCDDVISHDQPCNEARQGFGSPQWIGGNCRQHPSQLTVCQVKDPSKLTGIMEERLPRQKKMPKLTEEMGESPSRH